MFTLIIPGEPKGKGRPRFTKTGQTYTPRETRAYEELIQDCFMKKYSDAEPIQKGVPVDIEIMAYFKRAKTNKDEYPVKKPDCDNIIKIVCDALNSYAYYDDAQIVNARINKIYTPRVDPFVYVKIREINESEDLPFT